MTEFNTTYSPEPSMNPLAETLLMVKVYYTPAEYCQDIEQMKKRTRLPPPNKKKFILFHCFLSHETIQFWKITNSYFFAKGNLALFCTPEHLNYEKVRSDDRRKWKEN